MNKIKTTKREMKNNYRILSFGYCDVQSLLAYESPVAYSAGVYGWSCDYYDIDGVIICTGYSPITTKNMKDLSYDEVREWEAKARSTNTREEHKKILTDFINACRIEVQ